MNNRWQVYDTSEPLLQWQFAVPLPSSSSSSSSSPSPSPSPSPSLSAVAGIIAAVRAALVPLVTVVGPSLPDADAALADTPGLFRSTVTVKDAGHALVDVDADDAGQLLRRLEGPTLDEAYARRFAARGHPFVAVWATMTPARLGVTVAFFATVWFNAEDPPLFAANQARLLAARAALTAVARRHGGQLLAPTALA